ncbi:MAG: hypothetical protein K2M19_07210 [Muribaculaceae bacterium]|nr:hypothetical protein [Muribaculaceae bacterium]
MKNFSSIIPGILLGAAAALTACSDNWEQPVMNLPELPEGLEANITLAQLKADYWQDNDSYGTIIGCNDDGDSLIVIGTVVSNASAGNIYKTLVIQDESAAITIGVDTAAVSAAYPQGARLAVNVTGMCFGRYNGLVQLGVLQGSGVNRISMPELRPHVKMGFKGGRMDTTLTTIAELNQAARTTEGKIQWQSRLIRINGVQIVEAGQPFTNGNTTSRYLVDEEGNRIILYNSSYADFAYETMPYGKGDVVAILSCYRNSWQLLLNDAAGLIDFDGEGQPDTPLTPSTPEGEGTFANPFNAAAANAAAESGSTAEVYVKGIISEISEIDTGTYGNATYYISDPNSYTRLYIYRGYGLDGKKFTSDDQLEIGKEVIIKGKLTTYNGNPQIAQGSQIVVYDGEGGPQNPSDPKGQGTFDDPFNAAAANAAAEGGSTAEVYVEGTISEITEIDTGTYGNATYYISDPDSDTRLYIYRGYGLGGQKFTSADQLQVGKKVLVKGKLTTYNGKPQIAQGSEIVKYDGQGDDPVPTPVVAATMLDGSSANGADGWTFTGNDKWAWQNYKNDYYLNISCQNDPQTDDLYAISPVIDLAAAGYTSMAFSHAAKFQNGGFKEKCHIAVREEGSENWTVLPFTGYPGTDSWTFVNSGEISISAFAGKKIQVAFVYGAGCTDKWEVNNLTFSK